MGLDGVGDWEILGVAPRGFGEVFRLGEWL